MSAQPAQDNSNQWREDADRWNDRYSHHPENWLLSPRSIVNDHLDLFPPAGMVLDAAMGTGANADLLIRHGLSVIGLDISLVALRQAVLRNNKIRAVLADLHQVPFENGSFDLILNLYFLDRALCSRYFDLLKPGGLIVFETLTVDMLEIYPDKNPAHLLHKGELANLFKGFEFLYYNEGWVPSDHGDQKAVASLVAVCPGTKKISQSIADKSPVN
jgi:SAM-dependent methyltransferase